MQKESSSSQNRKAGHTLTHTHTQDDYYTLAANAYTRVTMQTFQHYSYSIGDTVLNCSTIAITF